MKNNHSKASSAVPGTGSAQYFSQRLLQFFLGFVCLVFLLLWPPPGSETPIQLVTSLFTSSGLWVGGLEWASCSICSQQMPSVPHPHPLGPLCHFAVHWRPVCFPFIPDSQHLQWCAGGYLKTTSGAEKALICNASQFPLCNYSNGWFQAINVRLTSLQNPNNLTQTLISQ